jgi:hypothetical protein
MIMAARSYPVRGPCDDMAPWLCTQACRSVRTCPLWQRPDAHHSTLGSRLVIAGQTVENQLRTDLQIDAPASDHDIGHASTCSEIPLADRRRK